MIKRLQAEEMVAPSDRHDMRVLNGLAGRGIALQYGGAESPLYSLAVAWKEVDVSKKPPKKMRLAPEGPYASKSLEKKSAKKLMPSPEKGPVVKRPPAKYSNLSQDDLIDHILKNY